MNHSEKIMVIAESDARFDGYEDGLVHLSKMNRERYIARATRSYYALQQAIHHSFKSKISSTYNSIESEKEIVTY